MVRKVIYIATRETLYSRVSILGDIVRSRFDVLMITLRCNHYIFRITAVVLKILWTKLRGRFRDADAVVVGFFAQPILPVV